MLDGNTVTGPCARLLLLRLALPCPRVLPFAVSGLYGEGRGRSTVNDAGDRGVSPAILPGPKLPARRDANPIYQNGVPKFNSLRVRFGFRANWTTPVGRAVRIARERGFAMTPSHSPGTGFRQRGQWLRGHSGREKSRIPRLGRRFRPDLVFTLESRCG